MNPCERRIRGRPNHGRLQDLLLKLSIENIVRVIHPIMAPLSAPSLWRCMTQLSLWNTCASQHPYHRTSSNLRLFRSLQQSTVQYQREHDITSNHDSLSNCCQRTKDNSMDNSFVQVGCTPIAPSCQPRIIKPSTLCINWCHFRRLQYEEPSQSPQTTHGASASVCRGM